MSIDLTGITNKNEYYTNHYFSTVFEENTRDTISGWNDAAREAVEVRTPWSLLREAARQFRVIHDRFARSSVNLQVLASIKTLADNYMQSLGYPEANPEVVTLDDSLSVPVYLEMTKSNGAPLLWIVLAASKETGILESLAFNAEVVDEDAIGTINSGILGEVSNEELVNKILFGTAEPPRFIMLIGLNQIALIDRNKWNEKRYLQFELEEIFSRTENSTLQAMSVLLHKDSLCPEDGKVLLDELEEQSQRNSSGVSKDLKYALRESIELLGNEVLYDMKNRLGRDLEAEPVDAGQLTLECLRYMYRMLFVLFIESRPELGYAPMKVQSYCSGYSLESLRDIADNIRDDVDEVGSGYYLHETLAKLYELIYYGYPKSEEELKKATGSDSLHDMFLIAPLKAHIFDPEYTKMISNAKLRNSCMLRIIDLMSVTRTTGRGNSRRGRISYANLGINQMGAVYEALLSYRGFIAEHDLYEVKRAGESFNELDVGYFVSESELGQYTEEERVRYEYGEKAGKLRMYEKGTFIYRLAGREREKSASYYTPEVLTKCLVKYALKELLEGKTADEILELTICEPAMGSAAFLNEAINQLAEAYVSRKEQETGEIISYDKRFNELQKVKMFIADRNVYGIDLNPVAVELAEVSLWLNTIYEGGYVPWFGTQLVNGNSLIGARRQCYRVHNLKATTVGLRWYENAPERVLLSEKRADKNFTLDRKQVYHFLLGDTGMASYNDRVIKSLEPEKIKAMKTWNKRFTAPYDDDSIQTLLKLSSVVDSLWEEQVENRKALEERTQDNLSVFGHNDNVIDSNTSVREKDRILHELYKSEHQKNAGAYARLKFAMDYWCALWFWPIEQADLLPSRTEFLFDLTMILEGTPANTSRATAQSLFDEVTDVTQGEQLLLDFASKFTEGSIVDLDQLCAMFPRMELVRKIAEVNKFMHWELEFAELFAERGGFDLILGNPPWIKITWNEHDVLSDSNPMFAVKMLSATQTTRERGQSLSNLNTRKMYFAEYESLAGEQNFLNCIQLYTDLKGQQTNLYKCFLPQAFMFINQNGYVGFIHPDGVFDDPRGESFRTILYKKLTMHYSFINQMKLFDIGNTRTYSLNVYTNKKHNGFDCISNLFVPSTIDGCYDKTIDENTPVPGIKENGVWATNGHPKRVVRIDKNILKIFSAAIGGSDAYEGMPLPLIHSKEIYQVLERFAQYSQTIASCNDSVYITQMWNETAAQNDNILMRNTHFGESENDVIYSGAHIGVANPVYKTSQRVCETHRAFDYISIEYISDEYLQRTNYSICCSLQEYNSQVPKTFWESKYDSEYRLVSRKMIDPAGERTLMSAIIVPGTGHTNGLLGIAFKDVRDLLKCAGAFASIPFDFFIKMLGKSNFYDDTVGMLPLLIDDSYTDDILVRVIGLNGVNRYYDGLIKRLGISIGVEWSKLDKRLERRIINSERGWNRSIPFRSEFERRQALIEIDVLVAMSLKMSLEQLKTIYKIQFPVSQQYEEDTWYDENGRIVFTNNRSLTGVGFSRPEWENSIKDAPAGSKFYRTIMDDTMPDGPVERTIEYVAPFVRCDREKDYEVAWKFFEEKYGN